MTSRAAQDRSPAPPARAADVAGGRTVTGNASRVSTWTIAEIAEEFGVTHRTIRHYEDLGLIHPERRGTTRVYHRRDKIRLSLVLKGKRLGFPLEEIRRIVDMYDDHPGEAGQLRYLLAQIGDRRADLEQRRADLDMLLHELDELQRRCEQDLRDLG